MSADTVPTVQAERDARAINTESGHKIAPSEIAIGVIIGRTSEFFDFFVYAIASVLVFPALVFPFVDPLTGTLFSFAIFALAFVTRPLGSLIFMAVDRQYGRGVKLTIALFLLGGPVIGLAVGLTGGIHRYSLGGTFALAAAINIVMQGLVGGLTHRYPRL